MGLLRIRNEPPAALEPVERYVPLAFKLSVYLWLSYFFYQAAGTFYEDRIGLVWPTMLSLFRAWTFLPIHEAGHFIFILFGRTIMLIGGSFWQIVFPLLWFLIALKQRSHVAPFALFWVGENMMDVSLYMRDATYRYLPLLGGRPSHHDWYQLFTMWGTLDSAGTFADMMYYPGFIISAGAIASGFYLAFRSYFRPAVAPPPRAAVRPVGVKASPERLTDDKGFGNDQSNFSSQEEP